MVYEICALVATIILGVLGIEFTLWLYSVRKLTNDLRKTVQDLNTYLPHMLEDTQAVTKQVRQISEEVGGTVSEAASSLETIVKNPIRLVSAFVGIVEQVRKLWGEIRK